MRIYIYRYIIKTLAKNTTMRDKVIDVLVASRACLVHPGTVTGVFNVATAVDWWLLACGCLLATGG